MPAARASANEASFVSDSLLLGESGLYANVLNAAPEKPVTPHVPSAAVVRWQVDVQRRRGRLSIYQRPQVRHWNGSCVQIFFGVSRICREREGGRSEGERASIKKWVIPSSLGIAEGRAKWRKSAPGEALPSRVTLL